MQIERYGAALAVIMLSGMLVGITSAQDAYVLPSKPMSHEISIPAARVKQIKVVEKDGTITFTDSRGQARTYRRFEYKHIYTPMPSEVIAVKKAFFMLDMADVITKAGAVSTRSRWLGWGAYVAYLHAMALIEKKQFNEAAKILRQAKSNYARHEQRLDTIEAALKEIRYASSGGPKITSGKPTSLTAKLNGMAFQKANKTREAILEYMKVVTLFPLLTKKPERGTDPETLRDLTRMTTYVKLVSLLSLKQIGDKSTAGLFDAELRNEYRLR